MTPRQQKLIDGAFKDGVDALRFISPHLGQFEEVSGECKTYLKQKQDELNAMWAAEPRFVPSAKFDRVLGRHVERMA